MSHRIQKIASGKTMPIFTIAFCLASLGVSTAKPVVEVEFESSVTESHVSTYPPSILRQEVRLRKLHLVRPDLIQFPVSFEIYC